VRISDEEECSGPVADKQLVLTNPQKRPLCSSWLCMAALQTGLPSLDFPLHQENDRRGTGWDSRTSSLNCSPFAVCSALSLESCGWTVIATVDSVDFVAIAE